MSLDERRNTPRAFRRECADAPENVVFYSDDVLCKVAAEEDSLPEIRRYALAGLLLRYVLSPSRLGGGVAKVLLDNWLGPGGVERFHALCVVFERREKGMDAACLFKRFGQSMLHSIADGDMKAIESVVRRAISADGFIPVFSSSDAYLLPFHFMKRLGGVARVTDSAGTELSEWSGYLGEMQNIKDDVCVDVRLEVASLPTGDSLMLPLQLAAWRREGAGHFPQYSILRLYATGSLHGARLGSVDTKEKAAKIGEIDNALFVRPVDCSCGESGQRGQLYVGDSVETCRNAIAEWAETMTVCDPSYAIKRLDSFDRCVRAAKGQDWKKVCKALENLTGGFDRDMEPDAYLLGLMIRSAAACHSGSTAEAVRLNQEAEAFAADRPEYEDSLLRIRIVQLVILQDIEDFLSAKRLSAGVEDALEAYAGKVGETPAVRDLRMRFHGTMGQVLAAIAVSGGSAAETEYAAKAGRHCEHAYETALGLYRDACKGNVPPCELLEAVTNVVQDANYLVMWSALHDFASLERHVDNARKKAERLRESDSGDNHQGSERFRTNVGYCERFRLMGWYRELLKSHSIDDLRGRIDETVFDDDKVEFWVRALGKKYLGAFAAAWGKSEKAAPHFKRADAILERFTTGVIGMIRMTVLAETFRSLRDTPFADQGENARQRARAILDAPENAGWHASAWRDYLTSPDEKPFPGLTYWY